MYRHYFEEVHCLIWIYLDQWSVLLGCGFDVGVRRGCSENELRRDGAALQSLSAGHEVDCCDGLCLAIYLLTFCITLHMPHANIGCLRFDLCYLKIGRVAT